MDVVIKRTGSNFFRLSGLRQSNTRGLLGKSLYTMDATGWQALQRSVLKQWRDSLVLMTKGDARLDFWSELTA